MIEPEPSSLTRHVEQLVALADAFRGDHPSAPGAVTTRKRWCEPARTFTYHTHIGVADIPRSSLDRVADAFYRAADLEVQPWYPQFRGGEKRALDEAPPAGIARHQLAISSFEVGLRLPRCYRQLVCEAAPRPDLRVVSLRSVDVEWKLPPGTVLARTLEPTGDVFEWQGGVFHWHHICTTPGVGLFPGALDRAFLNLLRRLGLDSAERKTYREEAERFCDWMTERQGSL